MFGHSAGLHTFIYQYRFKEKSLTKRQRMDTWSDTAQIQLDLNCTYLNHIRLDSLQIHASMRTPCLKINTQEYIIVSIMMMMEPITAPGYGLTSHQTITTISYGPNYQATHLPEINISSCKPCSKKYVSNKTNGVPEQDDESNYAIKQNDGFTDIDETNEEELKIDEGTELKKTMDLGTGTGCADSADLSNKED
ncbi:hypothetical protein CCR75_009111 [Bremia lactucae]|uniref:Uncharacterized protein n=1 Tax=Bremia lactucae TaxID=4779 RepID=A0A976IBT1_BRELC|nr:hypothetical protein CCR75_009111 [Bremia lactucae]